MYRAYSSEHASQNRPMTHSTRTLFDLENDNPRPTPTRNTGK